jgi:hypothetical protein
MYYLKGLLISLSSVGILFLTLYFFSRQLQLAWFFLTVLFNPRQTGLTATVGNPALWYRPGFYALSVLVFAATFLIYLWRTKGL